MRPYSPERFGGYVVRAERDIEYDAFSRVTRELRQVEPEARGPALIAAVHRNNELWTILATDLAHPENGLPDEVRAGLLSLAGFSLRQGHAVLSGAAGHQPLIDINLSVMKGLRGEAQP